VVVQRDILAQIVELKETLGFSIIFITHDISLLLELADRIAVMYSGKLIEVGTAAEMQHEAAHPYTKGLLNSFPSLHGPRRALAGIPGSPPDLNNPPPGCAFLPRCGYGTEACTRIDMSLAPVSTSADPSHLTACPFVQPGTPPPARGRGLGIVDGDGDGAAVAVELAAPPPARTAGVPGDAPLAHALAPDAATALAAADGTGPGQEEPER
jgi:oligopeptide/dipeptide ABC transporter ATP-binding protein